MLCFAKKESIYIVQQRGVGYHCMGSMRRLKAGPVAPMRMRGGGFRGRGGEDHSTMSQTLLMFKVQMSFFWNGHPTCLSKCLSSNITQWHNRLSLKLSYLSSSTHTNKCHLKNLENRWLSAYFLLLFDNVNTMGPLCPWQCFL